MCASGKTTSLSLITQYKFKGKKLVSEKLCSRPAKTYFCSCRITQFRVIKESPSASAKAAMLIFTSNYNRSTQASLTPKII